MNKKLNLSLLLLCVAVAHQSAFAEDKAADASHSRTSSDLVGDEVETVTGSVEAGAGQVKTTNTLLKFKGGYFQTHKGNHGVNLGGVYKRFSFREKINGKAVGAKWTSENEKRQSSAGFITSVIYPHNQVTLEMDFSKKSRLNLDTDFVSYRAQTTNKAITVDGKAFNLGAKVEHNGFMSSTQAGAKVNILTGSAHASFMFTPKNSAGKALTTLELEPSAECRLGQYTLGYANLDGVQGAGTRTPIGCDLAAAIGLPNAFGKDKSIKLRTEGNLNAPTKYKKGSVRKLGLTTGVEYSDPNRTLGLQYQFLHEKRPGVVDEMSGRKILSHFINLTYSPSFNGSSSTATPPTSTISTAIEQPVLVEIQEEPQVVSPEEVLPPVAEQAPAPVVSEETVTTQPTITEPTVKEAPAATERKPAEVESTLDELERALNE